jgi:hypothetical protein
MGATGRRQCREPGANVAMAEPTLIGRVIAAWPSFALTASYELLTRQVGGSAISHEAGAKQERTLQGSHGATTPAVDDGNCGSVSGLTLVRPSPALGRAAARELQRQAWRWAVANRTGDGLLPSGRQIADRYGRHKRWGRLVKRAGAAGELNSDEWPSSQPSRL